MIVKGKCALKGKPYVLGGFFPFNAKGAPRASKDSRAWIEDISTVKLMITLPYSLVPTLPTHQPLHIPLKAIHSHLRILDP